MTTTIANLEYAFNPSKPVQVYRNLHRPGCQFSVKQDGRVRGYVDSIVLVNCTFKHASPKQLAEVRTGARQVCQWITGMIATESTWTVAESALTRVECDPKKADGFFAGGERINHAEFVSVSHRGCFASR